MRNRRRDGGRENGECCTLALETAAYINHRIITIVTAIVTTVYTLATKTPDNQQFRYYSSTKLYPFHFFTIARSSIQAV